MKQLFVTLCCLIFVSVSTNAQTVQEIVSELEDYGKTISTTNFDGSKSRQMILLEQLRTKAGQPELIELIKEHNNPMVKVFSFWSLDQTNKDIVNGFMNFEAEDKEIVIIRGCFAETTSLFSIFQKNILPNTKQNNLNNVTILSQITEKDE